MTEEQIRERVREMRSFYINVLTYGGVSVLCIFAWLLSGGGKFWPIWVIIGGGLAVGLQAFRLGLIPMMADWFPFLSPEWEEHQVAEMRKTKEKKMSPPKPMEKKVIPVKVAAKSKASKKPSKKK